MSITSLLSIRNTMQRHTPLRNLSNFRRRRRHTIISKRQLNTVLPPKHTLRPSFRRQGTIKIRRQTTRHKRRRHQIISTTRSNTRRNRRPEPQHTPSFRSLITLTTRLHSRYQSHMRQIMTKLTRRRRPTLLNNRRRRRPRRRKRPNFMRFLQLRITRRLTITVLINTIRNLRRRLSNTPSLVTRNINSLILILRQTLRRHEGPILHKHRRTTRTRRQHRHTRDNKLLTPSTHMPTHRNHRFTIKHISRRPPLPIHRSSRQRI